MKIPPRCLSLLAACAMPALLAGCGGSSGGGSGSSPTDPIAAQSEGSFLAKRSLPPESSSQILQQDPALTRGCEPGDAQKAKTQVDPLLKPGMRFKTSLMIYREPDQLSSMRKAVSVQEVGATAVVLNEEYEDGQGPIFGTTKGGVFKQTCSAPSAAASDSLTCRTETVKAPDSARVPAKSSGQQPSSLFPNDCELVGPIEPNSFSNPKLGQASFEQGLYVFKNGKSVTAYRLSGKTRININCNGQLQEGTFQFESVVSGQVPSVEGRFCGGTNVFLLTKITSANGAAKAGLRMEITEFQE